MKDRYDAVVVGAGLGGLSAAAALARDGRSVLVLEHHLVPGGYAHHFRRGPYRFDVSLHALDGLSPGGTAYEAFKDLGLLDRVKFERLDPLYVLRLPDAGGDVAVPADSAAYEALLVKGFPKEAPGIRALFDEVGAIHDEVRRLLAGRRAGAPPEAATPSMERFQRAAGQTWEDFLLRFVSEPPLLGILSALWGYAGLPPSRLNAAFYAVLWSSYHRFGAFYPQGGSMAVSRALEAVVKEAGGEVLYGQTVTRIFLSAGRAIGVATDRGLEVAASAVVANANAPDVMLRLVGRGSLPEAYAHRMDATEASLSSFSLFLGVERDLAAERALPHELFLAPDTDPEAQYRAIVNGDWERVPLSVTHYTAANPACAPAGCAVVVATVLAPWDYARTWGTDGRLEEYRKNPAYQEVKARVAAVLSGRLEEAVPGILAAVRYRDVSTPLTNHRYSLNHRGAIYGFAQDARGMLDGRPSQRTPIPNVFLAGGWTRPGAGQTTAVLSGLSAARMALSSLAGDGGGESAPVAQPSASAESDSIPEFCLPQVGASRERTPSDARGIPLVLLSVARAGADAAAAVSRAIRARHRSPLRAAVWTLLRLPRLPSFLRPSIERKVLEAVRRQVSRLPPGAQAEDLVVVLPDWGGDVSKLLGLVPGSGGMGILVADRFGLIRARLEDPAQPDDILAALRWL